MMESAVRVSADEAWKKMESGEALLVCAYADEEKFRRVQLKGAISLGELEDRLPSLPKDQEIIFYCS